MYTKLRISLLWLALFCCAGTLSGQRKFREHAFQEDRNKGKAILFNAGFVGQLPAADLSKRFGENGGAHLSIEHISTENTIWGMGGDYFFGSSVKEDPLAILRTPEGDIIGRNQAIAELFLRQRGFYAGAYWGKLYLLNKEKRSGIRFTAGGGWTQHWFRLQDDSKSVNQILDDYKKGYDRLTGGICLHQFIGWQHLGRLRRNNWLIGFDLQQGFTKTLRDWDFSEKRKLDEKRLDLRIGIKAAWTLPFYRLKSNEIYY